LWKVELETGSKMLGAFIFILLIQTSSAGVDDFAMPNYSSSLSRAVIDYIINFYCNISATVNFYYYSQLDNVDINLDVINEILYNVKTKIVFQVDGLMDRKVTNSKRMNNILFIDSLDSFLNVNQIINVNDVDLQGFFLIAITTHNEDVYVMMDRIFSMLWNTHIINVNVIFMPQENTNEAILYTFYPYTRFYCDKAIPVKLNQYRKNAWINPINYFPEKLKNFHQCTLHVATFEHPPFMMITQNESGAVHVDGLDGILLRVLGQRFHFNTQLHISDDLWGVVHDNKYATGAIEMVKNEKANFTIGFFASTPARDEVMEPSVFYYVTNLVWMVPPGKPQSALEKLANPLGISIWLWTLASIVIGFTIIFLIKVMPKGFQDFVFGRNIPSPALNLINIVFGGSLHRLPRRNFSRFILALFIFYCFIIRSSYSGGLVKFMQMDSRGKRVQSTAEMIEKDYKFYMLKSSSPLVEKLPHVLERSVLMDNEEFNKAMNDMTDDSDFKGAFLTSESHLAYQNKKNYPTQFFNYAPESIFTLNIVVYYPKESCLAIPFDNVISLLANNGLVDNWASIFINRKYLNQKIEKNNKALNFQQLKGAIELLVAGWILASVIFGMELLVHFLKKYIGN
jgi:hypothetical protein